MRVRVAGGVSGSASTLGIGRLLAITSSWPVAACIT
jgi:hypothetical protein